MRQPKVFVIIAWMEGTTSRMPCVGGSSQSAVREYLQPSLPGETSRFRTLPLMFGANGTAQSTSKVKGRDDEKDFRLLGSLFNSGEVHSTGGGGILDSWRHHAISFWIFGSIVSKISNKA